MTTVLLFIAIPSWGQSVIRGGKEWLQPIDFVGLSWDDVAAVCPIPGDLCSGTMGGTDVTGYKWASIDEINALFNSYGVSPPLGPGPDSIYSFPDSIMVDFFADFEPTTDNTNERLTWGWSVDEQSPTNAYNAYIGYVFADQPAPKSLTNQVAPKAQRNQPFGAWLYRPVITPVPILGSHGLLFTVLGLFAIASWGLLGKKKLREG